MHKYYAANSQRLLSDSRRADSHAPVSQQIEHWLMTHQAVAETRKRPLVTLAYAQSWDGSITTCPGNSLALSNTESTQLTHRLRSLHDGILVGIGTVLADDPQLTVRHGKGANPQPIVLDSDLRTPLEARLCQRLDKRCWILTCHPHNPGIGHAADVIEVKNNDNGDVDLHAALTLLWEKGIKTLMVEGGSTVITAFLRAQLVDAIVLTLAPLLVGGYKGVGELGLSEKYQMPSIDPIFTGRLGNDLIMWGDLQYPRGVTPVNTAT